MKIWEVCTKVTAILRYKSSICLEGVKLGQDSQFTMSREQGVLTK
jgi:hypothetical protein